MKELNVNQLKAKTSIKDALAVAAVTSVMWVCAWVMLSPTMPLPSTKKVVPASYNCQPRAQAKRWLQELRTTNARNKAFNTIH